MTKNLTPRLTLLRNSYVTREEYARRVAEARSKLRELGVTVTWVAQRIGRSRSHLTHVLQGHRHGPRTLALVEDLIDELEREVAR